MGHNHYYSMAGAAVHLEILSIKVIVVVTYLSPRISSRTEMVVVNGRGLWWQQEDQDFGSSRMRRSAVVGEIGGRLGW